MGRNLTVEGKGNHALWCRIQDCQYVGASAWAKLMHEPKDIVFVGCVKEPSKRPWVRSDYVDTNATKSAATKTLIFRNIMSVCFRKARS